MRSDSALYMGHVDSEIHTDSNPVLQQWSGRTLLFPCDHTCLDFFRQQARIRVEGVAKKQGWHLMIYRYWDTISQRITFEIPAPYELWVRIVGALDCGRACMQVGSKFCAEHPSLMINGCGDCLTVPDAGGSGQLAEWICHRGQTHLPQGLSGRFSIQRWVEPFQKHIRDRRGHQAVEQS